MTEVDYQHECDRAELLGLPKPDRNEFYSTHKQTACERTEEEILSDEVLNEGVRKEGFQRIGGGLEELNTILSSTQRKLNRFKTVCGSLSNLLKLQVGAKKEGNEEPAEVDDGGAGEQEKGEESLRAVSGSVGPQVKRDGNAELDKLDSLISKAEKAELSLSSQNKQIKKFLN